MTQPNPISLVRPKRTAAGLSQAELAKRVGVSRQTLNAVEAGRQVPSTTLALQLARALRCTVEELFRLPGGPLLNAQLVQPEGVADLENSRRVALGRVDGALIAHPLNKIGHAADGIISEVGEAGAALVELLLDASEVDKTLLVAGCAPLLGLLSERLGRRYRDAQATWVHADSGRALRAPGSGAQRVFERIAGGITSSPVSKLVGPAQQSATLDPLASGHAEVARLIRWGIADVGVAIESAALAENLDFIPVSEERFDLIIPDSRLEIPSVARFLDLIDQPIFRNEAGQFPGYDLTLAGHATSVL